MRRFARAGFRIVRNVRQLSSHPCSEPFNILFLGGDEFSCLVLRQLYEAKDVWQRVTVATQPDHRKGRRGRDLFVSPLKLLGQTLDLDVHTIPNTKQDFKIWKPPEPFFPLDGTVPPSHHLLVTASFGRILRKSHLELFHSSRRLNVHPSLLPAYRGPAPIQRALINDEKQTGVCIIEMLQQKAGIDCGDIWGQQTTPVPKDVMFTEMRDILGREGGKLLVSVLRDMLCGKVVSTAQKEADHPPAAPMILLHDSIVDPTVMTADKITRIHRAIQKPPVVRFRKDRGATGDKLVQLHGISVVEADNPRPEPGTAIYDSHANRLVVGCLDGTFLGVEALKQENRNLLGAKEWWNGASTAAGKARHIKFN